MLPLFCLSFKNKVSWFYRGCNFPVILWWWRTFDANIVFLTCDEAVLTEFSISFNKFWFTVRIIWETHLFIISFFSFNSTLKELISFFSDAICFFKLVINSSSNAFLLLSCWDGRWLFIASHIFFKNCPKLSLLVLYLCSVIYLFKIRKAIIWIVLFSILLLYLYFAFRKTCSVVVRLYWMD